MTKSSDYVDDNVINVVSTGTPWSLHIRQEQHCYEEEAKRQHIIYIVFIHTIHIVTNLLQIFKKLYNIVLKLRKFDIW